MGSPEWIFRHCTPDDIMDVVKWWTGSYRKSKWAGTIPNNKFSEVQGEVIRQLFTRGAGCILACNPDNPSQVLGFIAHELTSKQEPVVHYLFVKDIYRRRGVSKSLLEEAGIPGDGSSFFTHRTAMSKYYKAKHVPEISRRKEA